MPARKRSHRGLAWAVEANTGPQPRVRKKHTLLILTMTEFNSSLFSFFIRPRRGPGVPSAKTARRAGSIGAPALGRCRLSAGTLLLPTKMFSWHQAHELDLYVLLVPTVGPLQV